MVARGGAGGEPGGLLVVVDEPASIGALPPAVARDMGCPAAYLPGRTMPEVSALPMPVTSAMRRR